MTTRAMKAQRSRNPMTDPTTIPAMAPPLRPWDLEAAAPALALLVGEEVGLAVEESRPDIVEKTGRVTSWHRPWALEVKQQESVPFSVLDRQKLQRLIKLSPNPQLLGSFVSPEMQLPLIELAGKAQLVKSALSSSA